MYITVPAAAVKKPEKLGSPRLCCSFADAVGSTISGSYTVFSMAPIPFSQCVFLLLFYRLRK
ncbi:hypothetical protein P9D34_17910 [Bacillus swezeyi]|uniref:Uncharacterized protein n=1 Tax=Bacillus swezeyi TaxID=1925020 RepID=A0A1R1RSB7_9BACI|nr:hypothetical protein [Bacillus swezeyi]MEC1262257.1 hypothetical protein [Bacillus swezeyi]MED2927175.1 hypothetical protein [Bacillus swezeyi]MED2962373.1 hypothetical protein [Bacillus swezeyi]MED3072172.1 hypothetical protein [Bacillus swezeyi]MED3084343.1 hypothetical protein [Bacillus swezeyi]